MSPATLFEFILAFFWYAFLLLVAMNVVGWPLVFILGAISLFSRAGLDVGPDFSIPVTLRKRNRGDGEGE